ncbi:hypothetical protein Zmor_017475 [Zophobas morio]|uniref:Uncharacterized protein n=1 Tax=Zophobas morio TaxID=2755281 RepID=A0AA38IBH7_9CUCU|nr:hypothetical protein Zmor_017475 [Zophobas morio]
MFNLAPGHTFINKITSLVLLHPSPRKPVIHRVSTTYNIPGVGRTGIYRGLPSAETHHVCKKAQSGPASAPQVTAFRVILVGQTADSRNEIGVGEKRRAAVMAAVGEAYFIDGSYCLRQSEFHNFNKDFFVSEYIEKTHLGEFDSEVEFVKPKKISPLPLHNHDIIFDQMRNNYDKPPLRHHSGHFRHKEAEVWDPHPRYEIEAFGRKLFLELEHNDQALAEDLHVSFAFYCFTVVN